VKDEDKRVEAIFGHFSRSREFSPFDVAEFNWFVIAGITAIHIVLNYVISLTAFGQNASNPRRRLYRLPNYIDIQERKVEYAAVFVLISIFLYFMGSEVVVMMTPSGNALAGAYNITRAAMFTAIGLVAGGAFRNDKDVGAKESARQAESLRIARMALNASDTAVTFTDPHRKILWCNPSFLRLAGTAVEGEIQNTYLDVALSLSKDNAKKLKGCFRQSSGVEVELLIRGMIVHVRVSPSEDSQVANGFVVVLKDVTEERSLEQFIESSMQVSHSATQARNDVMHARSQHVLGPMDEVIAISSLNGDKEKGQ
jgi:PAS domain-containing protein